jgi:hypothetical protein
MRLTWPGLIRRALFPRAHANGSFGTIYMLASELNCFDANLPGAGKAVRIASFHDAKVFVRRWVIRDKDPALKALLRHMEKINNLIAADEAIQELQHALSSRGLLGLGERKSFDPSDSSDRWLDTSSVNGWAGK